MSGILSRTRNALRAFRRAYSGFDITGGSGRWPAAYQLTAPISQTLAARRLASRKVAHQVENNSLLASIAQHMTTSIIGDGPSARAVHPDAAINAQLQRVWNRFYADCAIEGNMSLGGYLSRVARALLIDGESATKLITDPQTMQLKLQLLSADQIDSSKTTPPLGMVGDAPNIISGVEFDGIGRIAAYWVLETPPDAPWASVRPAVRVPAEDIAHVYEPRHPGLPRGMSPLAPVAGLALELDAALDAAVVKMKVSALMSMIIRDVDGTVPIDTATDPASLHLEPGATLRLPPGTDVTFPPTAEMSSIAEVMTHIERLICAGAGVPYFLAAGDLAAVNFSAGKLGMASFQRRIKSLQANHITAQLLNKVWDRLVLLEILSGRMDAPDYETHPEHYAAQFLFPAFAPIDELKSARANTLNIAAKVKSRAEIISEGGRDPADVDHEIANDPYLADDLSASASGIASQNETENVNE